MVSNSRPHSVEPEGLNVSMLSTLSVVANIGACLVAPPLPPAPPPSLLGALVPYLPPAPPSLKPPAARCPGASLWVMPCRQSALYLIYIYIYIYIYISFSTERRRFTLHPHSSCR
jgi:hypothetical protein